MVPVLVDKARREDRTTDAYADAEDEAWLNAVLSGYEGVDLNEDDRLRKSSSSSGSTTGQQQSQQQGQQQGQISSSSKSHPCMLRRLVTRLAEMWNRQ
jgi:hypothetical protein